MINGNSSVLRSCYRHGALPQARVAAPPPPPPEPEAPPPTRRFTDTTADRLTLLGPTLRVVGEIESEDAVVIAGSFEGQIVTTALCSDHRVGRGVGVGGGRECCPGWRTHGRRSRPRARWSSAATSRVHATLRAHTVAMAEGSAFDGEVHMAEGASPSAFREKRRTR